MPLLGTQSGAAVLLVEELLQPVLHAARKPETRKVAGLFNLELNRMRYRLATSCVYSLTPRAVPNQAEQHGLLGFTQA